MYACWFLRDWLFIISWLCFNKVGGLAQYFSSCRKKFYKQYLIACKRLCVFHLHGFLLVFKKPFISVLSRKKQQNRDVNVRLTLLSHKATCLFTDNLWNQMWIVQPFFVFFFKSIFLGYFIRKFYYCCLESIYQWIFRLFYFVYRCYICNWSMFS